MDVSALRLASLREVYTMKGCWDCPKDPSLCNTEEAKVKMSRVAARSRVRSKILES